MIGKAGPDLTQPLESKVLVIVAGPSGSGKTVFINQFRSGTLAPALRELLPSGSERWPQIGANDCMKRGVPLIAVLPRQWTAPGGIVHYDTAYIHRFGLESYADDPVSGLFRGARQLYSISIAPSAAQLKHQFDLRQSQQRGAKKKSHLMWRDYVRGPLERTLGRLKGVNPRSTGDLYSDPHWLERCYEMWDLYVCQAVSGKEGSRHVTLEPFLDTDGQPRFRIVSQFTPANNRQPIAPDQSGA